MTDVATDFKHGSRRRATSAEWEMISDLKIGPCRGCGKADVSLHHLVPRSLGGDDVPENIVGLCGSGTTGCHGEWETRGLRWREVAAAIRASLTDSEHDYIVASKGEAFLDRYYPADRDRLCPSCRRRRPARLEADEAPRPRKSWTVSVPVDHRENGYQVLTELVEQARILIGRPEHTPPYFTLVEALAIFVRDARREAA